MTPDNKFPLIGDWVFSVDFRQRNGETRAFKVGGEDCDYVNFSEFKSDLIDGILAIVGQFGLPQKGDLIINECDPIFVYERTFVVWRKEVIFTLSEEPPFKDQP